MVAAAQDESSAKIEAIATAQMLGLEREAVKDLRQKENDGPWLALALSGGGIRSASFAMGVMQGLQAADVMKNFDYLSTVSGGGYIGASLSYFLAEHARHHPDNPTFWFPFGRQGQSGARGVSTVKTLGQLRVPSVAGGSNADADDLAVQIVSFIRQHAHYLTPTPFLGIFALIANALRAVLFSLGIYFAMLVLAMAAIFALGRADFVTQHDFPLGISAAKDDCRCALISPAPPKPPACVPLCTTAGSINACVATAAPAASCAATPETACALHWWTPIMLPCARGFNLFAVVGFLCVLGSALLTIIYSVRSYFVGLPTHADSTTGDPIRRYYRHFTIPATGLLGWSLKLQIACAAFGSLPWTYGWANQHGGGHLFGAVAVAISYLGTLWEKQSVMIGKVQSSAIWKSVWPYLYSALAIYGILFLAYGVAGVLDDPFGAQLAPFAILIVLTVILAFFTNLNLVSQHRMYRDRLMEALCPDLNKVGKGRWRPAKVADAMQLSALPGGVHGPVGERPTKAPSQPELKIEPAAPYHLINTALIIPDSQRPQYSGRGADNFVFSPRYCGSDATHWLQTEHYMDDGMMLPTAMAISGAALNARSGPDGKGLLRTPLVSFLVTLFGAQLGYWAPNPGKPQQRQQTPNYLRPGLSGLLGFDMDEQAGFLQLSDGGHFENLGLYELIRRKMDLIVVSDGGQDAAFDFADLGNAIERIRVDFGVSIHFDDPTFTLEGLLPTARDGASNSWATKFGLAKRGFALATIVYPDRENDGVLIYVKATMVSNLPNDLYAYKAQNPEFPDQTTLDQFFDEDQFEAYRELGYRQIKQMFSEIDRARGGASPASLPNTVFTFLGLS